LPAIDPGAICSQHEIEFADVPAEMTFGPLNFAA
jgi:hypothetical protein